MNIVQGDTVVFTVTIDDYDYDENDVVKFALASDRDGQAIIEKTMTYDSQSGEYSVELTPAETAQLIADERYWFDIGIQPSDGKFYRVIKCMELWILPGYARGSTE